MTTFRDTRVPASRQWPIDRLYYEAFERRLTIECTDRYAYIVIGGLTYRAELEQGVAA